MQRIDGDVDALLNALRALESVPESNYSVSNGFGGNGFGEPFVVKNGRCATVCNAAGWLAQNPYFTKKGLHFTPGVLKDDGYMPTLFLKKIKATLRGHSAVARVLGMGGEDYAKVFVYPASRTDRTKEVTLSQVIRRLRLAIKKAGGAERLQEYDDRRNPAALRQKARKQERAEKKASKEVDHEC